MLDAQPPVACGRRRSHRSDAAAAVVGASSRSSPAHAVRRIVDAVKVRARLLVAAFFSRSGLSRLAASHRPCRPHRHASRTRSPLSRQALGSEQRQPTEHAAQPPQPSSARSASARPGGGGSDGCLVVGVASRDDALAPGVRAAWARPREAGAPRRRAAGVAVARCRRRAARARPGRAHRAGRAALEWAAARAVYVYVRAIRAVRPGSGRQPASAARLPRWLLYVRLQCVSGRNEYILLQTCAGLVYKVGAQSMARPLRTQITQFMRTRAVYTATCMLSHADRTSKCPQNMRNLQRYKVRAAAALSIRRRHTCCARAAVSAMAAPHAASQRIDERAEISQHRCCGGAGGRLASKT